MEFNQSDCKKKLIELQKRAIVSSLQPNIILPVLQADGIITETKWHELSNIEKQGNREDAALKLLDTLIEEDQNGWAQSFYRALQENDCTAIICILEDFDRVHEMEMYRAFINLFYEHLVEIDPSDLYAYLQSKHCLSQSDVSRLMNIEYNELKVFNLLRTITKRHDWAAHFLEALKACKSQAYEYIICHLEPRLKKAEFSIKEQLEKLAKSQTFDSSCFDETNQENRNVVVRPMARVMPSTSSSFHTATEHNEMDTQPITPTLPNMSQESESAPMVPEEREQSVVMEHMVTYVEAPTNVSLQADPGILSPKKRKIADEKGTMDLLNRLEKPSPIESNSLDSINPAGSKGSSKLPSQNDQFEQPKPVSLQMLQESLLSQNTPVESQYFEPEAILPEEELEEFCSVNHTELKLYPFQEELAQPSKEGQNRLIVAPTNSGKTFVAMAIAKDHLEKNDVLQKRKNGIMAKKVIFLVPKVCLAKQQHRQFADHFSKDGYKIWHMTGRGHRDEFTERIPISTMFRTFDILVMTAQILVEGLASEKVSLRDISLLIFDECHNARGGNPMSVIMNKYLLLKCETPTSLPQVVGLTASVGIGKSRNLDPTSAAANILKLCAKLDSRIHIVDKEKEALKAHQKKKTKRTVATRPRWNMQFHTIVLEIMKAIETKVKMLRESVPEIQLDEFVEFSEVGSNAYIQSIVLLEKDATQMRHRRRPFVACLEYLKIFNTALILYRDCEAQDAFNHIRFALAELNHREAEVPDATEIWLADTYAAKEATLKKLAETDKNPKLERLKEVVLRYMIKEDTRDESRAIVMVTTRALTEALKRSLSNDANFKDQNIIVDRLVGSNAPTQSGGQTASEWKQTLDLFRLGKIKLLVSTTVVEEGLDIPDCSLLVKYELTQTEIGQVQAEGRARADDAMIITLGSVDSINIHREAIIEERVKIMHESIDFIHRTPVPEIQKQIRHYQNEIVSEEQSRLIMEEYRKLGRVDAASYYKLECARCEKFVCNAGDIRVYDGSNHVVVDKTLLDRVTIKPMRRGRKEFWLGDLQKKEKIYCPCGQDWGIKSISKCGKVVFILKQDKCFFVVGAKNERELLAAWKHFVSRLMIFHMRI